MPTRRTTLTVDGSDLAVIEHEARRRGVSLARVLRDLVAREATSLRQTNRPRFGIASGNAAGTAEESSRDEAAPARGRLRS